MRKIDLHQIGHRVYWELAVPDGVDRYEACKLCAFAKDDDESTKHCDRQPCGLTRDHRGIYATERNTKRTVAALIALRLEGKVP